MMNSANLNSYQVYSIYEPHAISDDALVVAAQSGEEWAFMELYKRNSPRVFRSIYRITKNREDAEDALQDSMLKAFLHLKRFDQRASFSTWFTRIGINSALMILRKRPKPGANSIDGSAECDETWRQTEIADRSPSPEESFARRERETHFQKALCHLPDTLRTVVEIRRMDEGSMKDIAGTLGISVPAAKSRLLRARAKLRRSLV
jgi:RNA polymerase sigma factor (sigma-70 family)